MSVVDVKYHGPPGTPIQRRTHDYDGDGESFICPRCGARVAVNRKGHAPGGGKAKPWSRCEEPEVATDRVALPEVTQAEADRQMLVTYAQIARRWGVSVSSVMQVEGLAPVARLLNNVDQSRPFLFSAPGAEQTVRTQRPRWVARMSRGQ